MKVGASLSVSGLIVFGTFTSLAAKIVYELDGVGRDGQRKLFEKPWAMTTVMFLGMTFCLPLAYYVEHKEKRRRKEGAAAGDASEPLLGAAPGPVDVVGAGGGALAELKQAMMLGIPTVFDLVATVLMNVGLLSVTASVYQMMRGAEMLFAALFAVVFLKRTLNRFHLMGIGCCVLGITLVGVSSMLSGEGSSTHAVSQAEMLLGMVLIILSQAVQAAQITFEDFFMADLAIPPLKIVGYEGLFGSLGMLCIMLPIVQQLPGKDGQGIHEDSLDTLHMITHTPVILSVLIIDMLALLMYNVSGMCVTGHLGAVFRTVLETTRTLFVWLVGLLMFYTPLGFGKLGESWSVYSWIQAAGFVVLVSGTLVYSKGDERAAAEELEEELAAEAEEAAGGVAVARPAPGLEGAAPPLLVSRGIPAVPIAVAAASLKSSMNISAFSLPSSLSHSLRARHSLRGTAGSLPWQQPSAASHLAAAAASTGYGESQA